MFAKFVERHRESLKHVLRFVRYDWRPWTRAVMWTECRALVNRLNPPSLDVLEISAGNYWRTLPFRSFATTQYPEFDICVDQLSEKYDLIIADQVFEHLLYPYRAARNVHHMLRPGGHFLIMTPFLVKIHAHPYDCTRWSKIGLKHFLIEAGFDPDSIVSESWGNRQCVEHNLRHPFGKRIGWFGSLANEPDLPVQVWALARKPA